MRLRGRTPSLGVGAAEAHRTTPRGPRMSPQKTEATLTAAEGPAALS